ncbi:MAG: hypothetical protein ACTSVY_07380 [Candidatus Helarchaeota archaeon]
MRLTTSNKQVALKGIITIIGLFFCLAVGFYSLGAALNYLGFISQLNANILTVLGIVLSFGSLVLIYVFAFKLQPIRRIVRRADLKKYLLDNPLFAIIICVRAILGFFILLEPFTFLIVILLLDCVDGLFAKDYKSFERHSVDKIVDLINAIPLLIIVIIRADYLIIWLALFAWRAFGQIYYHDTYSKAAFILAPNVFSHLASVFVIVTAILPQFTFIFEGFFFFTTLYFVLFISTFLEITWHAVLSRFRYAPKEIDIFRARATSKLKEDVKINKKYFSILANFFIYSISFVVATLIYYFLPSSGTKVFQLIDVTAVIIFLFTSFISLVMTFFIFNKSRIARKGVINQ